MLDDQVGRTIAAGHAWRAPNVYVGACCSLSATSLRQEDHVYERLFFHWFVQVLQYFALVLAVRRGRILSPGFDYRAYVSIFQLVHVENMRSVTKRAFMASYFVFTAHIDEVS